MTVRIANMEIRLDDGPALFGELTIESNDEVVWSDLPRPDPKWTYTDRQGHVHKRGDDGVSLPTLAVEFEHFDCDGACHDPGCEGWDIPHYRCPSCGEEEIKPGILSGPYSVVIPGLWSWSLKVRDWEGGVADHLRKRVLVEIERTSGQKLSGTAEVVGRSTEGGPGWVTSTTELVGVTELTEVTDSVG